MLAEKIAETVERIIASDSDKYAELVAERFRNEVPLQEEIFESLRFEYNNLRREQAYSGSRAKCDFWSVDGSGTESWVEIKLCPTNYCQDFGDSKKSIAITQQIGQVILDCEKLGKVDPRHERRIVLLAYPMPVGDDHPNWATHTGWILENAADICRQRQLVIRRNGTEVAINIYVVSI